jgi:hypothetical protein
MEGLNAQKNYYYISFISYLYILIALLTTVTAPVGLGPENAAAEAVAEAVVAHATSEFPQSSYWDEY